MLNVPLAIHEEKQLVLYDWSSQHTAVLAALIRGFDSRRCWQNGTQRTVAELTEGLAMIVVRS